jgi:hypothetical protein
MPMRILTAINSGSSGRRTILGTSEVSASANQVTRGQQENQVFCQRHIGALNVYNDEEHYGRRQSGRELERHTTIVTVVGELEEEEEECGLRRVPVGNSEGEWRSRQRGL